MDDERSEMRGHVLPGVRNWRDARSVP